ncbi:hypothetical protein [Sorangium sp. So ce1024]|uniref:hypothetical protein n=1 Tax=unclassified Sorangium TaxID=2621164 RepID=UPI003F05F87A
MELLDRHRAQDSPSRSPTTRAALRGRGIRVDASATSGAPGSIEVELEAGRISRVTDCSKAMADIRSRVAGTDQPGPRSSHEEIEAWIERAFSRKY